jgi:hypothetical protein
MKNVIVLSIIERLNHSTTTDNCIVLKSSDIQLATEFNFFELNTLYYDLLIEGYELVNMEKHTIKVKKTK